MATLSIKNIFSDPRRRTIILFCVAALLRLVLLDIKPPHFDEGVNGWFVDRMTETGFYNYDPSNYHGPLHFYALFLSQTLFGRNLWALRVPVVLVSLACLWLVLRFDRFFGRRACEWAAWIMALSPGYVFYSRYAIHEIWLVFFLMLFTWGLFGAWRFGARPYLWAIGTGATGMILTKETYVIHFVSFFAATWCLRFWEKWSPSAPFQRAERSWTERDEWLVIATSLGALAFFYSGGFMDFKMLRGLYETYQAWFATGTQGHGHEKACYYWITLMARYEWLALAGLAACIRCLWPSDRLVRFLAIYGTGTLAAYSIVRYKTPWCIISLLWPFYFVLGAVIAEMQTGRDAQSSPRPAWLERLGKFGIPAALALSLAMTVWLNFFRYADEEQPYVYVQTFSTIGKFTGPLLALAKENPSNYHLQGHILVESSYPLPWILGDFTRIGYYSGKQTPDTLDAAFLLVEEDRVEKIEPRLHDRYYKGDLRIRGAGQKCKLYLSTAHFSRFFPNHAPEIVPAKPDPGGSGKLPPLLQ